MAQQFPAKPVKMLVPYPAGGLTDVIARSVGAALAKRLGQPVLVENLAGASGAIAAQKVLNSPGDGYLIFQGSPNALVLAPLTNAAVKFKSEDFRLVQMIASAQVAFLARKDLPASNVDEFLAYARSRAAEGTPVTYASLGIGSFYHLLGEHMSQVTGIPMVHVPYKGGAPANQDLIGGQVDIFLAPYGKNYEELHSQGKLKVLAMLNSQRLDGVKHFPAIAESRGLKGFTFNVWTAYFVKRDTPEPVVVALHKALSETLAEPSVRGTLEANSMLVAEPLPLATLDKAYADSAAQFRAIARALKLQPQ